MGRSAVAANDVETLNGAEVAAPQSSGGPRPKESDIGHSRRPEALAAVIVAAAFVLRIYVAAGSYLNPDEALHYALFHQRSLLFAYKASLTNAHPPLIYVILYFWQFLGRSELMLRLPSVVAGTAFCWVLHKWIGNLFGRAAGLSALILAAFSPSLISLSAQVRSYSVMLFCMAGALYFLERALADRSAPEMWLFSAFLYLSILSHYSAAFFTVALGVYAMARIVETRPGRDFVGAWIAGQAGALAVYVFLYATHVSKIKPSEMELWANPHENAFSHFGHGSLAAFTVLKTAAIFRFIFLEDYIYWGILVVFLGAIVLLFANGRFELTSLPSRSWPLGLLLVLPFVGEWGTALAGIYPYSGSRQSAFLAPFIIAGVSLAVGQISGQKLWPAIVIAGLIATAGQSSTVRFEPYMASRDQSKTEMASAVTHIRQNVPRSDTILVDAQSTLLLRYYLCDPADPYPDGTLESKFTPFPCNGYTVIATDDRTWKFTPDNFVPRFQEAARAFKFKPGTTVWVFQSGWGANLDTELSWYVLKYRCLVSNNFGSSITVIPFVVAQDMSPDLPPGSPHLSKLYRCVQ